MSIPKIHPSEFEFCKILWEHEPINSTELVKLCHEKLEWKKSTTYTVIRKLIDRGVICSENAIVTSRISKEEALMARSFEVVDESFSGSLPGFVATFASGRTLSREELDELQKILDAQREKR